MIAKAMRGRGFAGLARYLEAGKDGAGSGRISWSEARNLPSNVPREVAVMMRATAAQSLRVHRPVYHLALSWDPDDLVDRRTIIGAADRVLRSLGLEEHQVLMVAHSDTRHAHVHLMINRVHPETGRVWKGWNDYHRLESILRPLERELGIREVPGHHARLPGQRRPEISQGISTGELRSWERTGERPFSELVREVVGKDFAQASSWADLEERLGRCGLRLEVRGRGMVVTDGRESMKCSSVARGSSRGHLEQRFGERYVHYCRERESARAVEGRGRYADPRDHGDRGSPNHLGGRSRDPERGGTGGLGPVSPGRTDGTGREASHLGPGGDGGTGDGRRSSRGSGGRLDGAVERVRQRVEQIERQLLDRSSGGQDVPMGSRRRVQDSLDGVRAELGRSVLALAPRQVQQLHQMLTSPQKALVAQAVRIARSLLLDQDRER